MSRALFIALISLTSFSGEWFGGYDIKNILYDTRDVVFNEMNQRKDGLPFEISRQLSVIKQRLYKHPWWLGRIDEVNWVKTDLYLFDRFKKTVDKYDNADMSLVIKQLDELGERYKKILKKIY